ncbi:polymerase [Desulfofundulus thermobenzoicus]|uniref:Polymerase n=1 Tax=Desulfofundulus thermobenzoicus TaxID=29376 RepID=A0A6N7IVC0_9FIRM|nr:O-antigen ligase family protein [Desulfofundulus thermobenzoicus]MQL53503.1 polymerase [Desulfofundulus thermobenzoicus]
MHEPVKTSASPSLKPQPILHLNLRPFFLGGLGFVLFTSPFMRGLFFQPELLTYLMITAAAFAFCVYDQVLRREVYFLRTPLDYAVAALVAAYALSLITAVHLRPAISELLKAAAFFMVYWTAARAVRGEKDMDRLLHVLYIAGLGVAAVGLLAAARVIDFPGAFENGVIMSTLQYKNALAVYLAAVNVLGLGLSLKTELLLPKIIYAAGNTVLITVILGTQSRGGWIIYPLAMAALVALIPRGLRWRAAYHLFIFLGCGLVTARFFYAHLPVAQGAALLKYLLAGLAAAFLLQAAYHFLALWLNRDEVAEATRRLVAVGGLAYCGLVLAVYLWYAAAAYPVAAAQILPGKVISRAETISAYDPSFRQRLEYYRDALRIVRDHPVTGAGGGGWNALYHRYASHLYWSTETHSHLFQTWVEAGTLGLAALLAAWAGFIRLLVRLKRRESGEGPAVSTWTAAVAALTLGVHSAFDFDLSLAALGIFLFALFGAVRGMAGEPERRAQAGHGGPEGVPPDRPAAFTGGGNRNRAAWIKVIFSRFFRSIPDGPGSPAGGRKGLAGRDAPARPSSTARRLILAAMAGTLAAAAVIYPARAFHAAGVAGAEGARALLAKDMEQAKGRYEQAHRLDPFTASYAADLAQIWAVQAAARDDATARYRAIKYAREAAGAEPYNTRVRATLVNIYSLLREYDLMVQEAAALVAADPLQAVHYEVLARARLDAARYHLQRGEKDPARRYLAEAAQMPGQLPAAIPRPTPPLILSAGQAAYIMGDLPGAAAYLEEAARDKEAAGREARLWLAALYTRQGQGQKAAALLENLRKEEPETDKIYREVLSLSL